MKGKIKAVFFDRDGTMTYFNPEKYRFRDEYIKALSGKDYIFTEEKHVSYLKAASNGVSPWFADLSSEREFYRRYYYYTLKYEGIEGDLDRHADILLNELFCNFDRLLFPETKEVLEYFYKSGYKLGVISDTTPSLEYTLVQLGIRHYFDSLVYSFKYGISKPDPFIFNLGLWDLGVKASESVFVDDCYVLSDGAREQGFNSFCIDRSGKRNGLWDIDSLIALIDFEKRL